MKNKNYESSCPIKSICSEDYNRCIASKMDMIDTDILKMLNKKSRKKVDKETKIMNEKIKKLIKDQK